MVRPGTVIGFATGVLLLGTSALALWYWNRQDGAGRPVAAGATALAGGESDSALGRRVQLLHDSLQALDLRLREAQVNDSELPAELVQAQAGLWERYTWARARYSDAMDVSKASPDSVPPGSSAPVASPAAPSASSSSELGAMLGNLATYLWILAGVGAFVVGVLAWLLLFRKPPPAAPSRPLTEPTVRMDRNVRMPVARSEGTQTPHEPTFTQMRAARAPAPREEFEDDDIPAAPLPRTGRHAWENTVSQPQPQMAPAEPTAVQDYVVSMAKRGRTPAEIARRLRIPQDQVDLILKLRRNS